MTVDIKLDVAIAHGYPIDDLAAQIKKLVGDSIRYVANNPYNVDRAFQLVAALDARLGVEHPASICYLAGCMNGAGKALQSWTQTADGYLVTESSCPITNTVDLDERPPENIGEMFTEAYASGGTVALMMTIPRCLAGALQLCNKLGAYELNAKFTFESGPKPV